MTLWIHLTSRGTMWDDYGGMAYRGEICKKRSLGVDAVSCHRTLNIISLLNETLTRRVLESRCWQYLHVFLT